MNDSTDSELLRAYIERHSEPAFAELVRRHVDFVYSAALRMVCDSHLAQDVTQCVFIALAKRASQLSDRLVLSGWLHRTAQNIAAQTVRSEVRRRDREQEAVAMNELLVTESDAVWEHIAPHLDAALGELSEADRDALLLRYFERKSARELAQTLGTTEEAAQKRVSRAVERLREFFGKRGVTVGTSGLVAVISTHAVQAAPGGLAVTISTATALVGTITTATATTAMNWINLKSVAAIIAATLAAGTGTYLVQNRETARLHGENQELVDREKKLASERDSALSASVTSNDELERLRKDRSELVRLRGEVGVLRNQTKELEKLREETRQLRAALMDKNQNRQVADTNSVAEQDKAWGTLKVNNAKQFVLGMVMYADDHSGQFPRTFDELAPYFEGKGSSTLNDLNRFEILYSGPVKTIGSPSTVIAAREKEASFRYGKWFKTYGFADGHSELRSQPEEGFDAWEKQHMISSPPSAQ